MVDIESWAPTFPSRAWKYVVLHHSGIALGDVAQIDAEHRKRRDQFRTTWPGIGYHFVIGNGQPMPDGRIETTYRWEQQLDGAHAGSRPHNLLGIGVCLIGDFEQSPPTPRQIAAVQRLLEWLCGRYAIHPRNILRHADVAATRCPGRLFPFPEVRDSVEPLAALATGQHAEEYF